MSLLKEVEVINEYGNDHFKKKEFRDALQRYEECITLSKKHELSNEILARSLINAALMFLNLKKYKKCRNLCTKCIRLGDTEFIYKVRGKGRGGNKNNKRYYHTIAKHN